MRSRQALKSICDLCHILIEGNHCNLGAKEIYQFDIINVKCYSAIITL